MFRQKDGQFEAESFPQILIDWVLVMATVLSLLFFFANLVRFRILEMTVALVIFIGLLLYVLYRTKNELNDEENE